MEKHLLHAVLAHRRPSKRRGEEPFYTISICYTVLVSNPTGLTPYDCNALGDYRSSTPPPPINARRFAHFPRFTIQIRSVLCNRYTAFNLGAVHKD
ncbi:unnamed protein product [Clavelina lepadiformis]|uniref:Uncharacterized protein n=1 Tax=Clavelina lepadiformis TaxID=159417 RepID=A0ABP0FVL0_CLALP